MRWSDLQNILFKAAAEGLLWLLVRSSVKGWVSSGTILTVQSQILLGGETRGSSSPPFYFCLGECRREGLSAWCTCGVLVNFKRVKQCTKRISSSALLLEETDCLRTAAQHLGDIFNTIFDICCEHGWFIQIPKFNHELWSNHLLHEPTESPE